MPTFKNITELKLEKSRLLLEINDIENEMHHNWQDLKASVTPSNILKQVIATILESKNDGKSNSFFNHNKFGSFSFFSNISKMLKTKLENKIKDWIYA